jgi:hypothetical protein
MFKYIEYTDQDRTFDRQLRGGYIQATGYPIQANAHVQNLAEEIAKSPDREFLMIVWENNYFDKSKETWDFYANNIIPHNVKAGRPIICDRDTFDRKIVDCQIEYPLENQCDFLDLVVNYLNEQNSQIIRNALSNKIISPYIQENYYPDSVELTNYHALKSARN